jgi:hypothetical protein
VLLAQRYPRLRDFCSFCSLTLLASDVRRSVSLAPMDVAEIRQYEYGGACLAD